MTLLEPLYRGTDLPRARVGFNHTSMRLGVLQVPSADPRCLSASRDFRHLATAISLGVFCNPASNSRSFLRGKLRPLILIRGFLPPPLHSTPFDDTRQGQREKHHNGKDTKTPLRAGGIGKRFLDGNANACPDAPHQVVRCLDGSRGMRV